MQDPALAAYAMVETPTLSDGDVGHAKMLIAGAVVTVFVSYIR
jgi:hypothetical protein